MGLKYRVLACLIISIPITIIALFLNQGSLLIEFSRPSLVSLGAAIILYALTLYAAFLSEDKIWTRTLIARFLKSLFFGSGIVALGVIGLYFQAQAYGHSLSINWFGFFWLLILFSGLWFTRTYDKKISSA